MSRPYQWKTKRVFFVIISLIITYLFLRVRNYEYNATVFLPKIRPIDVWEFVADFSNMKYLNPTIISFNIIDEGGNYEHWKYSTEYIENLSHWPYFSNYAVAQFDIKANSKKDTYFINSKHTTCLFFNFYCLNSLSTFKFSQQNSSSGNGAFCEEQISYQCPALLSAFCRREVVFQRAAIMDNLKKYFLKLKA